MDFKKYQCSNVKLLLSPLFLSKIKSILKLILLPSQLMDQKLIKLIKHQFKFIGYPYPIEINHNLYIKKYFLMPQMLNGLKI